MNRCCKKMALFAILALTMTLSLQAEAPRFAVVDLEKVFREYYKSRIAEETIRRQGEIFRTYILKLNDQLQKLQKEYGSLILNAQNIALSENERLGYLRAAEAKKKEVDAKKSEIELYGRERRQDLRRIEEEKRAAILEDIRKMIRSRAKAGGYDWVFDVSGKTTNNQSMVLVYPASADLTQLVLEALNRTSTIPQKVQAKGVAK